MTPTNPPEIVPSCFSDGEDQSKMCKAQRIEDSKKVITRCIGSQNREAHPALRGKCVEKICSEGSNTDCQTKGEFRVLAQYAELVTSKIFTDGETDRAPKSRPAKDRKSKVKTTKATIEEEIDVDPSVPLKPSPEKKIVAEAPPAPTHPKKREVAAELPPVSVSLRPASPVKKKTSASRSVANIKTEDGFKKVCVAKDNLSAPEIIRGKCATRLCFSGKCDYKGRKEMFDFIAQSGNETNPTP
ncbi:MAG: hypothetical protein ACKOX6_17540 [Bdellovibrio sp.]